MKKARLSSTKHDMKMLSPLNVYLCIKTCIIQIKVTWKLLEQDFRELKSKKSLPNLLAPTRIDKYEISFLQMTTDRFQLS